jgi:hypothetical protein
MKVAKKRINVDLTETMYAKVKNISIESGLPMSSIVTYAIMTFLDQRDAINMMEIYKKAEKEKILNGHK